MCSPCEIHAASQADGDEFLDKLLENQCSQKQRQGREISITFLPPYHPPVFSHGVAPEGGPQT